MLVMRETLAVAVLDADDAVLMRLVVRHRRDGDVVAAVLVVGLDHLGEAGLAAVMQHVGQQQRERLVADDVARAPDGVAEAERRLLAREARLRRRAGRSAMQLPPAPCVLPRSAERALELELAVEMVLDDALVAAGDEDEMLDARRPAPRRPRAGSPAGRRPSASPSAWPWWRAGSGCRGRRRGKRPCGCASGGLGMGMLRMSDGSDAG